MGTPAAVGDGRKRGSRRCYASCKSGWVSLPRRHHGHARGSSIAQEDRVDNQVVPGASHPAPFLVSLHAPPTPPPPAPRARPPPPPPPPPPVCSASTLRHHQHTCDALGVHNAQVVLGGGEVVGAGVTQGQHLCPHHVARPEAALYLDLGASKGGWQAGRQAGVIQASACGLSSAAASGARQERRGVQQGQVGAAPTVLARVHTHALHAGCEMTYTHA